MRLYVPAVLSDLAAPELTPRPACAVTPALRSALPEEDEEGLELSAFLSAADLAVLRLADAADALPAVPRRVVVALEVPDTTPLGAVPGDLVELASVVGEIPATGWSAVVSIHVDEPEAADAVRAALTDDAAFEELGEVDLLWFHPSERSVLAAEAG
ncbi:hypothetical protein C8046_17365 [Serinibacter arcticus]|uniref:Uncharacterized protein n=1 Tax=Serinibacter arcticus TaxID=1655435 RepID=A0A2U1ZYY1_9MICO|nr:hypothetical protein [Serinibacter arcticus]PWD52150.1 hypothetical protein C8046_17365 [Serinibacter arcticus]